MGLSPKWQEQPRNMEIAWKLRNVRQVKNCGNKIKIKERVSRDGQRKITEKEGWE